MLTTTFSRVLFVLRIPLGFHWIMWLTQLWEHHYLSAWRHQLIFEVCHRDKKILNNHGIFYLILRRYFSLLWYNLLVFLFFVKHINDLSQANPHKISLIFTLKPLMAYHLPSQQFHGYQCWGNFVHKYQDTAMKGWIWRALSILSSWGHPWASQKILLCLSLWIQGLTLHREFPLKSVWAIHWHTESPSLHLPDGKVQGTTLKPMSYMILESKWKCE